MFISLFPIAPNWLAQTLCLRPKTPEQVGTEMIHYPIACSSICAIRLAPRAVRKTRSHWYAIACAMALSTCLSISNSASAKPKRVEAPVTSPYSYADIADLAARAPTVAILRVKRVSPLPQEWVSGQPAGTKRHHIQANVVSLIRGDAPLAKRVTFLIDLPAERRATKAIKGKTFIAFGRTAGDKTDRLQLVNSNALLLQTPATETKVRGIATELLRQDAPPAIVGVGEAFHVAGTVAGEGETQVFLVAEGGQPVSLSIIRRPEMAPKFGVALGEIVDEAAGVPASDTLLWYRLACVLPGALPDNAVTKLQPADAAAARTDYRALMERLGPCPRTKRAMLGNSPEPG